MLKARLSSLLFACLASLSFAVAATEAPAPVSAKPPAEQAVKAATVNLNTADAATLQRELSGVGEAKAKAIVAYREEHGDFASVDELLEVKGIGEAILERNRDKLGVN